VVGKHLAEFVHAAERRAFRTTLAELARGGGRRQRALRILPRTGSAIDVEATVASVPKADDGATLLWLLRDVSEHVGAKRRLGETITEREAELEETRTRAERERIHLRDLMQRLNEGVIAIDQDLVVVYANGSARHFFLPTRLVEGASLPEPWPKVELRKLARELFTSRPKVADIQVDDGAGRTLSIRAIPAVGTETAGLVVSDISSRQRRERAEREFVANAAHELRTPLTAILGAIEVLQRGAKDEPAERERFLAHIERECARLERLTSALLVLARAQMGVEPPRLELVEVRPLLEEVAGELRPASRVRVEVSCAPELAVFANRPLLEQALGNLTSNAAKHTHRGTIALKGMAEGDALVALEVSDTGTGMAPDVRERGVERFYRKGVEPGFGLGLAIATEAARVLGGRIEIESRPGHGTTARILLPSAYMVRSE
jgi:two-component system phosphate regulon sensor histidine kinase PhoR